MVPLGRELFFIDFLAEDFDKEMRDCVDRDFEALLWLTHDGDRKPLVEMAFLNADSDMSIRIRRHNMNRILILKRKGLLPNPGRKLPTTNEDEDIEMNLY